ncbi:MAG: ribbon-helix-helix domain-containing protein [Holophagaceae bacterium]|jgi:hypothetical protein|nr:ribbon-helix-helix domain-containing protein [Holophagaceae bacterium]
MTITTLPGNITLHEAIRRAKADPNALTIEQLSARYEQSVREAEEEYGPHVPSLILHRLPQRGRPKNGKPVEPVKTKSVRMPPAFWDEMQRLASIEGLTVHSAMRTAMIEWVERKHAVTS